MLYHRDIFEFRFTGISTISPISLHMHVLSFINYFTVTLRDSEWYFILLTTVLCLKIKNVKANYKANLRTYRLSGGLLYDDAECDLLAIAKFLVWSITCLYINNGKLESTSTITIINSNQQQIQLPVTNPSVESIYRFLFLPFPFQLVIYLTCQLTTDSIIFQHRRTRGCNFAD